MAEEKNTELKWKFKTGDSVYSPAVSDGVVYFGSRDNHLYAVDINTGEEKWKYKTGKLAKSPPIVVDGIVYFENKKNHLYAVDNNTGKLKWKFKTGQLWSSPKVVDGIVCFAIIGNYIYALDSKTGEEKWKFKTGIKLLNPGQYPVQVLDGVAYFVVQEMKRSSDNHLYTVDINTGKLKWKFKIKDGVSSPPKLADGVVYFGSSFYFYALDVKTGEEKWKFETEVRDESPAVVEGVVYFGSDDNHLYALDIKTGEEKWKFKTGDSVYSPAVSDGVVYFGSWDNHLYAVDNNTGKLKWKYKTGGLWSSPKVVDGIVCFAIIGNYIYALDSKTGEEKWKLEIRATNLLKFVVDGIVYFVQSYDDFLYAVDIKTGEEKWKFKTESYITSTPVLGNYPVLSEGVIYIGSRDGYLYAVDIKIAEKLGPAIKAEEKEAEGKRLATEQTELEQKIKDFKKREAEAKDAWDIRKLADEIAEAGYPDRARKLYIKAVETAEKNKTFICYGKTPAVFDEDDVYIMEGGPDEEPITMNGDFGLWIKGERWEWIEIYDNQDYMSSVHVFNRSDGFGILSSNDGEYFGHRSVNIKYRKVKPEILKSKSFADIKLEDLEEDVLVCNYDDIRFNNFMIAGEYILHQKHGEDDTGIFGENCPWGPHTAEVNKSLFNVFEEGVPITPITSKNKYWESLESEDGQEEIESGEFNDREMFRWWGRCEGNVDTCMPVEWNTGLLLDFQGNYSMDYGQVLIRLDE